MSATQSLPARYLARITESIAGCTTLFMLTYCQTMSFRWRTRRSEVVMISIVYPLARETDDTAWQRAFVPTPLKHLLARYFARDVYPATQASAASTRTEVSTVQLGPTGDVTRSSFRGVVAGKRDQMTARPGTLLLHRTLGVAATRQAVPTRAIAPMSTRQDRLARLTALTGNRIGAAFKCVFVSTVGHCFLHDCHALATVLVTQLATPISTCTDFLARLITFMSSGVDAAF